MRVLMMCSIPRLFRCFPRTTETVPALHRSTFWETAGRFIFLPAASQMPRGKRCPRKQIFTGISALCITCPPLDISRLHKFQQPVRPLSGGNTQLTGACGARACCCCCVYVCVQCQMKRNSKKLQDSQNENTTFGWQ